MDNLTVPPRREAGRAASRPHPQAVAPPSTLRARARRRRALAALGVGLALSAAGWFGTGQAGAEREQHHHEEVVVVVAPGDTLWTLALPHAPADADPHAFLAEVATHNDVDPTGLRQGTVLRIPQG